MARTLRADGWGVADVHAGAAAMTSRQSGRRTNGASRLKASGIRRPASGVVLTGNELLIAGQRGRDYWLWVVDQLFQRDGQTFGVYADPAAEFAGLTKDRTLVRVPGSVLKAARQEVVPA